MARTPVAMRCTRLRFREWIVLTATFGLFGLLALAQGSAKVDERGHLSIAISVLRQGLGSTVFGNEYDSSNTPLPYVVTAAIGSVVPLDIRSARALSMIFSLSSLVVIAKLLAFRGVGRPSWALVVVLFMPYFLRSSFTYYMAIYGVFFAVLAFWKLDGVPGNLGYLAHGIFSACAVLCQQFYVVIPASVVLGEFCWSRRDGLAVKARLTRTVLACVPMAVPFLLFLMWGGVTHPLFRGQHIQFNLRNVTAICVVVGCWCAPFAIRVLVGLGTKNGVVLAALSALLTLSALPAWAGEYGYGDGRTSGIVFHGIALVGRSFPWLARCLAFGLCGLGLATLQGVWRVAKDVHDRRLAWVCMLLVAVYAVAVPLGERHMLPLLLCLLLVIIPVMPQRIVRAWALALVPVGSWFVMHWFFGAEI